MLRPFCLSSFRRLTCLSLGSLGAISYHCYTIHADGQASSDDASDYQVYRSLAQQFSPYRQLSPSASYIPPIQHGITLLTNSEAGILRYDAAVDYREPRWSSGTVQSTQIGAGPIWTGFGIFQGIKGWETRSFVHRYLLDGILHDLAQITSRYFPTDDNHAVVGSSAALEETAEPFTQAVDNVIRRHFTQLNEFIVDKGLEYILSSPSISAAVGSLSTAISGCTCSIALYESHSALLKVVTTGNSRAVLGRRVQSGQTKPVYEARQLPLPTLNDPPCSDVDFPNAFGLAMQKWSHDIQERLHREYLCEPPYDNDHTRMKSTAIEPCVQSIEVKPGDFLVMATDALWDAFSCKEVVDLVAIWLDHDHRDMLQQHNNDALSGIPPTQDSTDDRSSGNYKYYCTDINAAFHIIKNALYNNRYCLTAGTQNALQTCDPKQRNGIGIYVIFFDDCNSPIQENLLLSPNDPDKP